VNLVLRILLLIWICGYLFVSCVPLLTGHLIIGGITFVAGLILIVMGVMLYSNDLTRVNTWANDLGLNLISGA